MSATEQQTEQGKFADWAIVEIYGHSKAAGYVTSVYFGPAAMFRVDVPELPEREYTTERPGYTNHEWVPAGAKVKRPMTPARSELLGPGSIFRMTPCTEDVARRMIEEIYPRPLIVLELPPDLKAIPEHVDEFNNDEGEEEL
jgi:hypothetical protein